MPYPYVPSLASKFVTLKISDVSTAGQVYMAPGFSGRIKKITTAIGGAIGTAPAVLTVKISGTAVTGGVVSITHTSSAAGDVDSATPSGANEFTSTDNIEIETSGASTNTVEVVITLEIEPV
jgi:hypothetical protein